MGLFDSNIVKLATKQITVTGTATTGAYIGGASGIFDCKNYGIASVFVSGLSSGTQIVIKGGVSSAFVNGKVWRNIDGFPDYAEQVEAIAVNSNTFTCDVSKFNQAGFFVVSGSGETVTLTVVLMTGAFTDISMKSLSNAISGNFKEDRNGVAVKDNGVAVNSGTLKSYVDLSHPFAVIHVTKLGTAAMSVICINAARWQLPLFNERGEIIYSIKSSGIYYLCISGIEKVYLEAEAAASGVTLNLTFQELNARPVSFELKPEQTIVSGVATLSAGDIEKRISVATAECKFLLPFFKFFCVNAVYRDSSDQNVSKASFKISKFDFMDNGKNMRARELATASNDYAVQTDWEKLTAKSMTMIFNFSAASAGDLLYYEIKGIR